MASYPMELGYPAAQGGSWGNITGRWGPRASFWTPGGWTLPYHSGIDIGQSAGPYIYAVADGTVRTYVDGDWRNDIPSFGNWVALRASNGVEFHTAHMQTLWVEYGQKVKRGQILGVMGTTGKSTGTHLHFEVVLPSGNHPVYGSVDPFKFYAENRIGGSPTPGQYTNYAFGLSVAAQKAAQAALTKLSLYTGPVDGAFGEASVRGMQEYLKMLRLLPAEYRVDGIPGPAYGAAVQRLAARHGYTGPIDGDPGVQTSAGIIKWAGTITSAKKPPVAPPVSVPTYVSVPQLVRAPGGDPGAPMWPTGEYMQRIQRAMKKKGRYNGAIDGIGGIETAKGIQLSIKNGVGYRGPIDGKLGKVSATDIQRYAAEWGNYRGRIDGDPRENSWINFTIGLETS